MTAKFIDGIRTWSGRYYCDYSSPCIYYDLSLYASLLNIPDESKLFLLTDAQWASRKDGETMLSKHVSGGEWTDITSTTLPAAPTP